MCYATVCDYMCSSSLLRCSIVQNYTNVVLEALDLGLCIWCELVQLHKLNQYKANLADNLL